METVSSFFKRKDVVISAHRYGIDAMGAMVRQMSGFGGRKMRRMAKRKGMFGF